MLGYMDITCDVKLNSANKYHMLYDQLIGNWPHRAIISAKELQLPDNSGLSDRLIDYVL